MEERTGLLVDGIFGADFFISPFIHIENVDDFVAANEHDFKRIQQHSIAVLQRLQQQSRAANKVQYKVLESGSGPVSLPENPARKSFRFNRNIGLPSSKPVEID